MKRYNWKFEREFRDRKKPSPSDLERPYGKRSSSDNLNCYLNSTRQIGHTRTLKKAIENIDVPFYLVSINLQHANEICKESMNPNAKPTSINLLGSEFPNTPVIMDNSAYMRMCESYDNKLIDYFYQCRELAEDIEKYCEQKIEFIENQLEIQVHKNWKLKMELLEDKKIISHYKERMNEEKEKKDFEKEEKDYYKQSKQDFLNGLTLFQRIFKKVN